jgi:hypothetical protein
MSITPVSLAARSKERVKTWVKSQRKLTRLPGQISTEIYSLRIIGRNYVAAHRSAPTEIGIGSASIRSQFAIQSNGADFDANAQPSDVDI